jgi:hypothetical protein
LRRGGGYHPGVPRERLILIVAGAAAAAVAAALLLAPEVGEELAPEPRQAWVAIQPAGSEVARVGPVDLAAGTPFTLHAVLEARDRQGRTIYYTAAPALEMEGRRVAAEALRPWDRPEEVKVLWFTVEGAAPFLPVATPGELARLELTELFRADWPQTWSVPGTLEPRHDDHLRRPHEPKERPFGTQRFHARVEIFPRGGAALPAERYKSWGAAELRDRWRDFPTVTASLPGAAGPASRAFGLTQVEPPEAASPELMSAIAELAGRRLVFSLSTVLRDTLAAAGAADLTASSWRPIALSGSGLRWETEVRQGDLLRSGDRVVLLHRDAGTPGTLDGADLALTFERGPAVLPLGEVFAAGAPVELAPLARR